MKNKYTRVYAEVSLDAITDNIKAMKAKIGPATRIMGVVKADGYGHGAVPVALALAPYVMGYAVAAIEEAVILRRHGIEKPVLVLGVSHPDHYPTFLEYDIRPVIFTLEQARPLSELAVKRKTNAVIHLAVDTGMHRIGMAANDAGVELAAQIAALPGIVVEGIFTHFASADEHDKRKSDRQFKKYQRFVALLEQRGVHIPLKHCSNSAAIIDLPETSMNLVRAGIAIYGMYPSEEVKKQSISLVPALALKSRITYIKTIEPGSEVSYGGTFCASKQMRVATIPVGYGDGYPRNLSNRGYVLIRGKKAAILGRICMDQFMVDVSEIQEAAIDDEVTLIGSDDSQQIRVEDLAAWGGGFHYEIVCDIGKRVPRVYYSGGQMIGCKDYFDDIYHGFGGL